jgi:putative IMPACT (imprinted ancient) family translation regulator
LGNIAVIVTLYYGSTKLGTGGLVRAYGDAVRAVLEVLPRARKIATHRISFRIPYPSFERVRRLVTAHHGQMLNQEFGAEVAITVCIPVDEFPGFRDSLQNATNGAVGIEIKETNPNTLLPLA